MKRYDVVVVGGGATGSVVASRLSEDHHRSVLLLEAGVTPVSRSAFPADLLDPTQIPGARPAAGHHWPYPVRLTPDAPYNVFRGRVLGGSATTNGGYFIRAREADFQSWAAAGNPAWSYPEVLPHLRRLEHDHDYGETAIHGGFGPVPVRRPELGDELSSTFAAAADDLGFPAEEDKNDQGEPGFGAVPMNISDGVRWNSGLAYVVPVLDRPNLTVAGGCEVERIRFYDLRAVGVDVRRGRGRFAVEADHVILCAGAFETAHLLLRSGIGPAPDLHRVGIPVVHDMPGVGAGFSDHPQVVLHWTQRRDVLPTGQGWLSAGLHFRSSIGPDADLEILQSNVPLDALTGNARPRAGRLLPMLITVNAPVSAGTLRLVPTDTQPRLDIDYNYLSTPADRTRLRDAVRTAIDVLRTAAFSRVSSGPSDLDVAVLSNDRALDSWIRHHLGTALHASGTTPMGPVDHPAAVVNQFGRVHGIDGLRIADTSILPAAPLRGPAATAVLIGEVIAAAIRTGLT